MFGVFMVIFVVTLSFITLLSLFVSLCGSFVSHFVSSFSCLPALLVILLSLWLFLHLFLVFLHRFVSFFLSFFSHFASVFSCRRLCGHFCVCLKSVCVSFYPIIHPWYESSALWWRAPGVTSAATVCESASEVGAVVRTVCRSSVKSSHCRARNSPRFSDFNTFSCVWTFLWNAEQFLSLSHDTLIKRHPGPEMRWRFHWCASRGSVAHDLPLS